MMLVRISRIYAQLSKSFAKSMQVKKYLLIESDRCIRLFDKFSNLKLIFDLVLPEKIIDLLKMVLKFCFNHLNQIVDS